MNKWTQNKWMNEWMKGRMNKWINELIAGWKDELMKGERMNE